MAATWQYVRALAGGLRVLGRAGTFGIAWLVLVLSAPSVSAKTIVLTNDDGLTSNVLALYQELKAQGYDVIVSVPCTGQSGMGAAIHFFRTLEDLARPCLHGAAQAGDPGAGPMTRPDLTEDFYYVDGTPVMALLYGLDTQAQARWGRAPDLVLSGPNEGRNVGGIVISSGTVSNAQYAAMRGIPAIAFSAGEGTRGDGALANPQSRVIARLAAEFVNRLYSAAPGDRIMPEGTALNVNFPDEPDGALWVATRIGTYNRYQVRFAGPSTDQSGNPAVGGQKISVSVSNSAPDDTQLHDEAVVSDRAISVSLMQIAYDSGDEHRAWLATTMDAVSRAGNDASEE